ncbi:RING-H2 finger protein ATL79-like [Salvia splendens]|uniref:RING-H2 finger protein ATL79-like n=1 Tax=Salvia splendens TaxID=180675 RepID=UPI001C26A683|nr:RING-H2 finger protein ATL79-like [Salvia splendens]
MRKIPSIVARAAMAVAEFDSQSHSHISPSPPPVSHLERCDAKNCPWWPYSSSKEFKANTALIIAVLFCALAFNAGIRYIVRLYCGERRSGAEEEIRVLSYSEGMKLGGEETECIICLGDFAVGEKIEFSINVSMDSTSIGLRDGSFRTPPP